MKCHYEILCLSLAASEDDIKRSYRKLALKWHPDKNLDNPSEAKEQFQLIQQAYDVLGDRQERAWYDNHREAILKGGVGKDYKDESVDLFQYFSASCYRSYSDDDERGFYSVYRRVFETIVAEDSEFSKNSDSDSTPPTFGDSTSSYEDVVHTFYAHWQSYTTTRSYAWLDPHDIRDAPNRRVLRLAEKENRKIRERAKRERNEQVRSLVAFVRKRDRRVKAHAEKLAEKSRENARKAREHERSKLLERAAELKNHRACEWTKFSNVESKLCDVEASIAEEFGETSSDDEDSECTRNEALYCVACNKIFKTAKAFGNHENSKRHRDNLGLLRTKMENDEDVEERISNEDESEEREEKNLENFGSEVEDKGATGPEMEDFLADPVIRGNEVDDEESEGELYSDDDEDSDDSEVNGERMTLKEDLEVKNEKMISKQYFKVKNDEMTSKGDFKVKNEQVTSTEDSKVKNKKLNSKEDRKVKNEKSTSNEDRKVKNDKMTSTEDSKVKNGKLTLNEDRKVKNDKMTSSADFKVKNRKMTSNEDSKVENEKISRKESSKVSEKDDEGNARKSTKNGEFKVKEGKMTLNENIEVIEDADAEDAGKITRKNEFEVKMTFNENIKVIEDIEDEVAGKIGKKNEFEVKKGNMDMMKNFKVTEDAEDGEFKVKEGKMTSNGNFKVREKINEDDIRKSTKNNDFMVKRDETISSDNIKVTRKIEISNSPSLDDLYVYPEASKPNVNEEDDETSPEELISDQDDDDDDETTRASRKTKKKAKIIRKVKENTSSEDEEKFNEDFGLSKKQRRKRRNLEEILGRRETSEKIVENVHDTRTTEDNPVNVETDTIAGKTKGKRAKEMRKAKKNREKDDEFVKTEQQRVKRETKKLIVEDIEHRCVTCKIEFSSKNKLYDHLKKTGHSVYLPGCVGKTRNNKINEKKSRGRARSESDSS